MSIIAGSSNMETLTGFGLFRLSLWRRIWLLGHAQLPQALSFPLIGFATLPNRFLGYSL
ncbi:hypothetical protein [Pararhizobium qamdonense]|uniref:hypothetical protein n=1 Tax=Pararhizobium qamdonense TaxID=3031126 RepID=UPI0023E1284A|nr:hypothetical protein [Pararhizobium qamdonense]